MWKKQLKPSFEFGYKVTMSLSRPISWKVHLPIPERHTYTYLYMSVIPILNLYLSVIPILILNQYLFMYLNSIYTYT